MKQLEEAIKVKGKALNDEVLLVDSFLNNQVDACLMEAIGEAFAKSAENMGITKVVTVEASGIAPAVMTALKLNVPLVILKKAASRILNDATLTTEVFSFTKNKYYSLTLKKEFFSKDDKVLFIDDFLANGEAATGASRLIEQTGASIGAIGIVIEKSFQRGRQKLIDEGYRVISLARVGHMDTGVVELLEADA